MILAVSLLLPLWAQDADLSKLRYAPNRSVILQGYLNRMLRWKAHWYVEAIPPGFDYRAGKNVPVSVVYTEREIALMLEGLGFSLRLHQDSDGAGVLMKLGEFVAYESREQMVNRYIRSLGPGFDCKATVMSGGPKPPSPGTRVPGVRVCMSSAGPVEVNLEEMWMTLPDLRGGTAEWVDASEAALRSATQLAEKGLVEFGSADCHKRAGFVPHFSRGDPEVYVLMEACGAQAIQVIHPDVRGGWEVGKLLVNAQPNEFSELASRIRTRVWRKIEK